MEDLCQMCQIGAHISLEMQFKMQFWWGAKLYREDMNSTVEFGALPWLAWMSFESSFLISFFLLRVVGKQSRRLKCYSSH